MPYRDMRDFLAALEQQNLPRRITRATDPMTFSNLKRAVRSDHVSLLDGLDPCILDDLSPEHESGTDKGRELLRCGRGGLHALFI